MTAEFATFPTIYRLPGKEWQWCLLGEVYAVAMALSTQLQSLDFARSPEDLVQRFACLAKTERVGGVITRYFYFTGAQSDIERVEVPFLYRGDAENSTSLQQKLRSHGHGDLFVARGWVQDTLKLVAKGIEYTGDVKTSTGINVVGIKRGTIYLCERLTFSHD